MTSATATAAVGTAVFPVAGLGTRFLPATRAVPKELLPVVDRPLIQYAVAEAVEAGAETLVFVVSRGKESIVDHFRRDRSLERRLEQDGKDALLASVRGILPDGVRVETAVQDEPRGLGHAVWCAREFVDRDELFAVLLPDDMVHNPGGPGALAQLAAVAARTGGSVIGVEEVDPQLTGSYGIAEVSEEQGGALRITSLVEKPAPAEAPSNLGVVGRYVLHGRVFDHLDGLGAGAGGEIQLTDAIAAMLRERPVYAQPLQGTRYDCGQRLGMLKANIDYALDDASLRPELLAHLRTLLSRQY